MDEVRVALLEIGSNSTKLLIADARAGDFRVHRLCRRTTRIGRGIGTTGRITDRALSENVAAIENLKRIIARARCDRTFAFATFALRRAGNAKAAARRLERAIGEPLRILGGREEARFAYASAERNLRLSRPAVILIDIGGGSTEIIAARKGRVVGARSLSLGALGLTEEFIHTDPVEPGEFAALDRRVSGVMRRAIRDMRIDRAAPRDLDLAASGGTIGALSRAMASSRPLPAKIRIGEASAFLDRCLALPLRERSRIPGLDPARADIVCAGLAILLCAMRIFGKRIVHPNDGGAREGALLHIIRNDFRW